MTKRTTKSIDFTSCKGRKVEANFTGGEITSDAGVLLLGEADRRLNLINRIAAGIPDKRSKKKIKHTMLGMLRQRIYGIALGYEDLNDHDSLRSDTAIQTAVGSDLNLASSPTLCRMENSATQPALWHISDVLVDVFIESFKKPPKRLVLDFDCTDDPVHGHQIGRFFHGYYNSYCFLPLYVFCGDHLLSAYLRPSNIDPAYGAWGIMKLLSRKLRAAWPGVQLVFRADSGFCRHRMMNWFDKNDIEYIIGIGRNNRLEECATPLMDEAFDRYMTTKEKQRIFGEFQYAADTWKDKRRIIAKAEITVRGPNPRFVVTNMKGRPRILYEKIYCARGEAENRIKEQQLDLFGDRTSCMNWLPNQYRVLLSAVAYTLVVAVRRLALKKTKLARSCCGTIRLKLFKIGAVLMRNTRRVRIHLSGSFPHATLFRLSVMRLKFS